MPSQSFTATDTISLWVYTSADIASGDLKFGLGTTSDITAHTFDVPAITHGVWTYVTGNVALASAVYYGFEYTQTNVVDIYLDVVQGPVPASDRTNMPVTYVDSLEFTVVNSLGGQPIDFSLPTDTNNDGVINSSDAAKTNYLTISYDDAYQQVSDLAWTVTRIVGDTTDYLLENNEIFKVTVDLKAVNLATTGNGKIGANHTFNLEVKPATGASLHMSKTTPQVLHPVDDLN
jgi:archaellin